MASSSIPELPLPVSTDGDTTVAENNKSIPLTDDGGLSKIIITPGSGPTAKSGDKLKVHYTGTLLDGSKFDSSRDRDDPFEFKVGMDQVIKGWDLGMVTMQRGERSTFTIRGDYGYGARGSPPKIPANATLVFDVEMLDFESPEPLPSELPVGARIEKAKEFKALGNTYFGQKNYAIACSKYNKALEYTDASDTDEDATAEQITELSTIGLSCNLNSAQAKINLKEYKSAINLCDEVLGSDAGVNNVKALYRRAVAQAGTGNNKAALKDLAAALKISPKDKSVKKKIKAIRQKVLAQKKREKKAYGGLFSKLRGGMYNDKKVAAPAELPSDDGAANDGAPSESTSDD